MDEVSRQHERGGCCSAHCTSGSISLWLRPGHHAKQRHLRQPWHLCPPQPPRTPSFRWVPRGVQRWVSLAAGRQRPLLLRHHTGRAASGQHHPHWLPARLLHPAWPLPAQLGQGHRHHRILVPLAQVGVVQRGTSSRPAAAAAAAAAFASLFSPPPPLPSCSPPLCFADGWPVAIGVTQGALPKAALLPRVWPEQQQRFHPLHRVGRKQFPNAELRAAADHHNVPAAQGREDEGALKRQPSASEHGMLPSSNTVPASYQYSRIRRSCDSAGAPAGSEEAAAGAEERRRKRLRRRPGRRAAARPRRHHPRLHRPAYALIGL